MNLNEWFDKGLTIDEYNSVQNKHQAGYAHILKQFSPDNDEQFFNQLKNKNLRVVAIVEEWCGHCMLNVPLLIHLGEKANIPLRFLPRDNNLELMEHYLTNEKRIIPIFIFIDENGNEVAKWGPISQAINEFVDQYRKNLPEKDSDQYEEAFQTFIKIIGDAFKSDEKLWHASYNDIKQTISEQIL